MNSGSTTNPVRPIPRFTAAALVLNSLFEVGAGALILVSPGTVFPAASPHAAAVARTLACAAISAGAISLVMLLAYQPGRLFRALLWILVVFHVLLAAMHGFNWTRGFTASTAPFGHLALAVLFAVVALRKTDRRQLTAGGYQLAGRGGGSRIAG